MRVPSSVSGVSGSKLRNFVIRGACLRFRGPGSGVSSSGFRDLGFRVPPTRPGLEFWVPGFGFRTPGFGFQGVGLEVYGGDCRIRFSGNGFRVPARAPTRQHPPRLPGRVRICTLPRGPLRT